MADDRPWRHRVVQRNGLVEVVKGDQVQDRREGLFLHDVPLVAGLDDGRLHEVARRSMTRPPVSTLPPAAMSFSIAAS
jgi:hypothetical protein